MNGPIQAPLTTFNARRQLALASTTLPNPDIALENLMVERGASARRAD